jgi:hypothetical protein
MTNEDYNKYIILILCFIPVLYIWALPLLSKINFSEDGCYYGIQAQNEKDKDYCQLGHSISAYISNPQATGAMAFVFSFPIIIMWLYKPPEIYIAPLSIFTVFFGLFLICSVTFNIYAHLITVFIFCFAAIFHFILFAISPCVKIHRIYGFLIFVSIVCFVALIILGIIFMKHINKQDKPLKNTYWVWIFECIGLSSLILFTPIYLLKNK